MTARSPSSPRDPLAAMLPLLRALPLPAVLHRPDGTVAGASAVFEELLGISADGMTTEDLGARLQVRVPTGRELGFEDLRRHLKDLPCPETAIDLRDRDGLYRAMIATAGAVRSDGREVGVVVLLTEVTGLVQANGTAGKRT